PNGENAVDRRPPALQADVRGRKSEALAETEPANDPARHAVVAAEHRLRLLEIAGRERGPDRRAADARAVEHDRLDDRDVESVPLAGAAQIFERAAATAAEAKIVADDDVTCAEPRDEHLLDERPRLESAELAKARAEELVDTGGVEQLEAL